MSGDFEALCRDYPLTWLFHKNTSRWAHNAQSAQGDMLPRPPAEYPDAPYLALPTPRLPRAALGALLRDRVSCRRFENRALALGELGDLLHAGYGVLDRSVLGGMEFLERPVPSGGGLYPLELYVLSRDVDGLCAGIHHYAVVTHGLEQRRDVALPAPLRDYLFMGQTQLTAAAAIIVIAAAPDRLMSKYGDRGYRYMLFEAGHVAQNLNLAASAAGLGSCNMGGFFDQELGGLLRLDPDCEVALYAVAIGHRRPGPKAVLRGIDRER